MESSHDESSESPLLDAATPLAQPDALRFAGGDATIVSSSSSSSPMLLLHPGSGSSKSTAAALPSSSSALMSRTRNCTMLSSSRLAAATARSTTATTSATHTTASTAPPTTTTTTTTTLPAHRISLLSSSSSCYVEDTDLEPLARAPSGSQLLGLLEATASDEGWRTAFDALTELRRIALFHCQCLMAPVSTIASSPCSSSSSGCKTARGSTSFVSLLLPNVLALGDSLRSNVAKNAMLALHSLLENCAQGINSESLERIVRSCMRKAANPGASHFLVMEARRALALACHPDQKILTALLRELEISKASSKIRSLIAEALALILHRADRRSWAPRDWAPLARASCRLASDPNAEARKFGRLCVLLVEQCMRRNGGTGALLQLSARGSPPGEDGETELLRNAARAAQRAQNDAISSVLEVPLTPPPLQQQRPSSRAVSPRSGTTGGVSPRAHSAAGGGCLRPVLELDASSRQYYAAAASPQQPQQPQLRASWTPTPTRVRAAATPLATLSCRAAVSVLPRRAGLMPADPPAALQPSASERLGIVRVKIKPRETQQKSPPAAEERPTTPSSRRLLQQRSATNTSRHSMIS